MYTAAEWPSAVAIICLTNESAPGGLVVKIGGVAENPDQAG